MKRIITHVRPSGERHFAISGIHISKENRRKFQEDLRGMNLGNPGIDCPECGADAQYRCKDEHGDPMPWDTVHLSRAIAAQGGNL